MSIFSRNRKPECPVDEKMRLWLDNAFLWLVEEFGEENTIKRKILRPDVQDFPVKYDGNEQTAYDTLNIVALQMEIDPSEIELSFFDQSTQEFYGGLGHRIFTKIEDDEKTAAGYYSGKNENGKYHISLELKQLTNGESMIGTFAHEFAHIKLLGEGRIKKNNEPLTDLLTVIYGLGIFNANGAFNYKTSMDGWGYQKTGYLSQMEWGYALALFAYLRKEYEPDWIKFLTLNIQKDLKNSIHYIDEYQLPEFVVK